MADEDINLSIEISAKNASKALDQFAKSAIDSLEKVEDSAEDLGDELTSGFKGFAKEASKAFKSFTKSAKSGFDGARKGVNSFADSILSVQGAIVGAIGFLAGGALISGIDAITEAASRQEDAINNLNSSLVSSGEFSQEASDDLQAYAASIQATTKFGDEAVLEQLALAKAFGATNEQAKEVTTASIELAAATGKSLEEATRQVSKTLGGFAGELGEVNPAIKALTAEQLKNGEAAKILIEQYGGTAARQLQTFSGAVAQTANTFGDLQEELGFAITQNPVVVKAINSLNTVFKDLITLIDDNEDAIGAFIADFVKVAAQGLPIAVKAVQFVSDAIQGVILASTTAAIVVSDLALAFLGFAPAAQAVQFFFDGFRDLVDVNIRSLAALAEVAGDFLSVFDDDAGRALIDISSGIEDFASNTKDALTFDVNSIKESIQQTRDSALDFGTSVETQFSKVDSGIAAVQESADKFAESVGNAQFDGLIAPTATASGGKGGGSSGAGISPQQQATLDALAQAEADSLSAASKSNAEAIAAGLKARQTFDKFVEEANKKILADVGKGVGLLAKGADGAKEALVEGGALVADAIIPGAGAVAKPLLDILSAGPEAVEAMVTGFVSAIPSILDNIALAIPVLVQTLAENIDEIVIALAKAAPAIARALFIEVPKVLAEPTLWADVASALVQAIAEEVTGIKLEFSNEKLQLILNNFVDDLTGAFNQGASGFEAAIRAPFNDFLESLNEILSSFSIELPGSSSGGGITGGIIPGLAEGGKIPAGFNNDTFPALLSSGEEVIPPGVSSKLDNFLDEGTDMTETNTLLAQLIGVMSEGGNQTNISINEDGLSDILLNLDRRNERTSAA